MTSLWLCRVVPYLLHVFGFSLFTVNQLATTGRNGSLCQETTGHSISVNHEMWDFPLIILTTGGEKNRNTWQYNVINASFVFLGGIFSFIFDGGQLRCNRKSARLEPGMLQQRGLKCFSAVVSHRGFSCFILWLFSWYSSITCNKSKLFQWFSPFHYIFLWHGN